MMKIRFVLKVLQLGFNVMFSDVDIGFFQDPFVNMFHGCDLIGQQNGDFRDELDYG